MTEFIFSADGHVREPNDLFLNNLPASFRHEAIRSERVGDHIATMAGERVLHRLRLTPENESFGGRKRIGGSNLDARLLDMRDDGVDAEIVFPSLGLHTYHIDDSEIELATTQIYNDWNNGFFKDHLDTFVRCAILPVRDQANCINELKRVAAMGFTAAMTPSVPMKTIPGYNNDWWDPIFETAASLGVVLVLHTGTGLENAVVERGPGGAVINYTRQMCDAQNAIMALVAGGVLDRNPTAQVAVIESGASWLAGLAERMDEVYDAHAIFVRPKLSLKPSEIIRRQVKCSFQYDRACIMSRSVTGYEALLWGSDYPHAEGTFPKSRDVLAHLFDGIEISETEKACILGLNAARLFRLPNPAVADAV